MKRFFYFSFLIYLNLILLTSCTSNEEKATKTIGNFVKENVENFESYSPITTSISEAKNTFENNPEIQELADKIVILSIYSVMGTSDINPVSELESLKNQMINKGRKLNNDEIIGWVVVQKFKYKVKYEKEIEVERRFILSPDFKEVLYAEQPNQYGNDMVNNMGINIRNTVIEGVKKQL